MSFSATSKVLGVFPLQLIRRAHEAGGAVTNPAARSFLSEPCLSGNSGKSEDLFILRPKCVR